jgi:hypothetical protein
MLETRRNAIEGQVEQRIQARRDSSAFVEMEAGTRAEDIRLHSRRTGQHRADWCCRPMMETVGF